MSMYRMGDIFELLRFLVLFGVLDIPFFVGGGHIHNTLLNIS